MLHNLIAEFLSTGLMILFGVGVHCDEVFDKHKISRKWTHLCDHNMGLWHQCLSIYFGGVCMNPAMVLAQCTLGMLPWTSFIPYVVAEFLGALVGALICYVMYKDHFTESEGNVNPIAIRNIFSTNPNCRNLPRNFFVETIATTIFLSAILAVATKYETQLPIGVGLIVWAVGMGLGGTTGFAMNQARDLGPRLAFQLLPIKNKANNDWQYGLLVPGIAPFVGALIAALFCHLFLGI